MNKTELIKSMPSTMTRREVANATGINIEYIHAVCYREDIEFKVDRMGGHKTKTDLQKVKEMKSAPYSKTLKEWAKYLGLSKSAVCRIRSGKAWNDI